MRALRNIFFALMIMGLLAMVGLILRSAADSPGPTLYVGGPILTMDAKNRVVEALAVDGERIAAAGDEATLREWAEEHHARVVDLEGRALLPGFIDAHGHFPGSGISEVFVDLNSPPIGDIERIDHLVSALAARAAETPPGEWIVGFGYDDSLLEERRHPTRHELDLASTEHPIAILHVSGHLGVSNGAGLEGFGIDNDTPDPVGGLIRRDPTTGEPDGVLEETAMASIQDLLLPSALDGYRIVQAAVRDYLSQGVTTAQSGAADATLINGMGLMSRLGLIPLRLILWPLPEDADLILSGELEPSARDPLHFRIGAVKLIADGSIQGYTGYLSEPYHVPPGDDPEYRGYPRIPRDELFELVARYHKAGFQLAIHGNGDASIEDILDAVEQAQRDDPRADARTIVIHAQMTRDDQLDRMKELGVIPSFFSLHTFYWGDRHRRLFMGPERAARMSPAAGARERGIRFTIHADTPVVPMEPLRLVWSAVNRRTRSGYVVGPEQRISVMEALRAVTIDAAYQHFEEGEKGSLEPGKLADLVILSGSPLDDPAAIDRLQVIETIIGGHTEYRAVAAH